ncbi:MAG: aldehyde dehydrogenase family protein [Calditrichaceae bacterium]|nr:aldehyde dehydrogenase family protein [Calditrichaceae bacterium]
MDYTSIKNPITGEELGQIPLQTVDDLKTCITKARHAQKLWAHKTIAERIKHIIKIRDYIVENAGMLAETIARDNGKIRADALITEVLPSAIAATYYCKMASKFLKEQKFPAGCWLFFFKKSRLIRVPYGIIGIISPWNYPFSIPFYQVIMALLAGNAVILKTATETQSVGLTIKETIASAGLPDNLFQFINLPGKIAGPAFLENGIDKLFFTGSVKVGKFLMAKASETLTPVNLELGGNDAMIVCEDADLVRAANGAVWAGLSNTGQSCGGVERIYVHENVYADFLTILKEKVENLSVDYDLDYQVDMSGMTTENQVKTVKYHVEEALEKGARIFAQSKIPDHDNYKNFYPACVLTDVNHDMLVMKDETFGPVLGVMKIKSTDEAIRLANDSYLGLTGSVWSRNRKKAEEIGRQIQAGVITINDHLMSHGLPETSWGGFKQSGIGRSHGRLGFDEMTQPQFIINDIIPFAKKQLWWHPYDKRLYDNLVKLIDLLYSRKIMKRLKGFYAIWKVIPRIFKN